jgi:Zn-dependent peptidase ImmA (M78 family)
MDDLRGFTLMDSKPFAIVLNNSDAIQARIFTLLHEYAHLLLNEPALCIPQEDITVKNHKAYIEKWCNSFAAAFLLPKSEIITDFNDLGFANYKKIAKRYNASLSSTLTRLYNLNLISHDEYYGEISILQNSTILKDSDESQGYGLNSAKIAKRDKGLTFISLVLENAENDFITNSDVLDYLNIKIKHIEELTNLWV